jgi:hypothetical protein
MQSAVTCVFARPVPQPHKHQPFRKYLFQQPAQPVVQSRQSLMMNLMGKVMRMRSLPMTLLRWILLPDRDQ